MIDKIQAFGDSFVYGTDLPDCRAPVEINEKIVYSPSNLTWQALAAKELGLEYGCRADGGFGNQFIASRIFQHAKKGSLVMVNWSWIDRFDYMTDENQARTLRPGEDTELERFYYKNLHSEMFDKFRNLVTIWASITWLRERNIPFIMTIMDQLLLDDQWHVVPSMVDMQNEIRKYLTWFPENRTFLEWSRANGYPESEGWHPLEEAHAQAAEIMLPIIKSKINTYITTTQG